MLSRIKNTFAPKTHTPADFTAAVYANNLSLVKACIKQNPSLIHTTNPEGETALFIASQYAHFQIADFLLANGANPNQARKKDGVTPLLMAAENGHKEIVELLLKRGANANLATTDNNGRWTPLTIAAYDGRKDIVALLLSHRANVDQARTNNSTPLFMAAQNGHKDIVELLLDHGANANLAKKTHNATPLFIAALYGHKDTVELLLNRGVDMEATTNLGTTPLFMAARYGHKDTVELLLNRGANANQTTTQDGATPLFAATVYGHKNVVELLLDHDVDIHLVRTNKNGSKITAYEQAINFGYFEIAAMIRKKMAPSFSDRLEAIEYDESIPDKYLDTIASGIMNDPITVSNGITYDRDSLAGWFKQNNNPEMLPCPTTKRIIHRRELVNRANVIIKNDIEAFVTEKEKESKADKAIPSMRALSASGTLHFSSPSPAPAADGIENCPRLSSSQ